MSLRRWKKSRANDASIRDSITVVSASVRAPDETHELAVVITVTASTVAMHADDTELGTWSVADVTVLPIDTTSFAFDAEGDSLILVPDDPVALRESGLVAPLAAEPEGRWKRGRKKDKKPPKAEPAEDAEPKPPRRERTPPKEPRSKRTSVWIRSLDMARRHDVLGLDRVQVDEKLRGQEHEHTWNSRVAATSGPGRHICTICGKIRARAS